MTCWMVERMQLYPKYDKQGLADVTSIAHTQPVMEYILYGMGINC